MPWRRVVELVGCAVVSGEESVCELLFVHLPGWWAKQVDFKL